MTVPQKRPAFEVPGTLPPPAPTMRRPISTTAGAALVLLRVVAGAVWILSATLGGEGWASSFAAGLSGETDSDVELSGDALGASLAVVVGVVGVVLLIEAVFGLLILWGRNFPRVVVMVISVLSISTAFTGWWVQGQEIRLSTTLVTLALDILVLLALSSRSAAAYARRRDRR